jgi:ATP-dependent RNA helicase DDX55/SPB4
MSGKNNKKRKASTVPSARTSNTAHEKMGARKASTEKEDNDSTKELKMIQQASTISFESLKEPRLSKGVLEYIQKQGFTRMTPVQVATIPQFLSHEDVAVQSVTGSGKTLAFLIPVLEILQQKTFKRKQIGALILSPTRELAQQTYAVAKGLCECCAQPEPLLLVGGGSSNSNNSSSNARPVTTDVASFQELGSDLVIGTPGRINDILSRFAVMDCSELICLILDEADVLLNMGFATTLQNILSHLPKMRRTALFSATQSSSTSSSLTEWMHRIGMRNPVWIDVTIVASQHGATVTDGKADDEISTKQSRSSQKYQATPSTLLNYYVVAKFDEKLSRLAVFLQQHANEKIIVFFLTCACVDFFGNAFQKIFPVSTDESPGGAITIEMLHGKMVQKRRERTMERFRDCQKEKKEGIALFCTDVAARGLDVSDVQWVVQVDAPQDPAFFVHRVGRSARAGKVGQSLIFLSPKEEAYVDFLRMRNIPIEPLPSSELCAPPPESLDLNALKKEGDCSERLILGTDADGAAFTIEDVLTKVLDLVARDRDILEKGTRAFTSYIRAYKEHHCSFIFRYVTNVYRRHRGIHVLCAFRP